MAAEVKKRISVPPTLSSERSQITVAPKLISINHAVGLVVFNIRKCGFDFKVRRKCD
jgi:hypothetical protein